MGCYGLDERFEWDLTGGEPLLAGLYSLMAPMLAPIAVIASVLWLIGAGTLKVAGAIRNYGP